MNQIQIRGSIVGDVQKKDEFERLRAQFESEIRSADEEFAALCKTIEDPLFLPYFLKSISGVEAFHGELNEALQMVPISEQREANEAVATFMMLGPASDSRAKVEAVIAAKYPDVVLAIKKIEAELDDPFVKSNMELKWTLERVVRSRILCRVQYAQLLQQSGFEDEARRWSDQARHIAERGERIGQQKR